MKKAISIIKKRYLTLSFLFFILVLIYVLKSLKPNLIYSVIFQGVQSIASVLMLVNLLLIVILFVNDNALKIFLILKRKTIFKMELNYLLIIPLFLMVLIADWSLSQSLESHRICFEQISKNFFKISFLNISLKAYALWWIPHLETLIDSADSLGHLLYFLVVFFIPPILIIYFMNKLFFSSKRFIIEIRCLFLNHLVVERFFSKSLVTKNKNLEEEKVKLEVDKIIKFDFNIECIITKIKIKSVMETKIMANPPNYF